MSGVLAATVVAGATAVAAWGSGEAGKATLTLRSEAPLVVGGRGFRAGERVVVSVKGVDGAFRKSVRAGRKGGFSVRFESVEATCGPLYVVATGRSGSGAVLRRPAIAVPCGALPG